MIGVGWVMDAARAILMVAVMCLAPLSGCFGEDSDSQSISASSLNVSPDIITGGDWTVIELDAKADMSVFVPYFVQDPGSKRAQNGTVLDLKQGESVAVNILFPPRNSDVFLLIGDYGRVNWPIRAAGASWVDWVDGNTDGSSSILAVVNQDLGGEWSWIVPGNDSGGDVVVKSLQTIRSERADLTDADGVGASGGWVNGRDVYEWVELITDDTPCTEAAFVGCGPDLARGYLDRWVGNGNPSYEHAVTYFEGVMLGYGLDRVEVHRFQSNTAWSVNICGYKTGSVYPDEWLIFGAHFDIAPPVAYTPGAEIGIPGYGTRHGAYDNAAGSSMVLSTASVLAEFDARRTMVFCLWSSEEEGLWDLGPLQETFLTV